MTAGQHYMDGAWVGEAQLVVSVRDLSVVRGYGVFDALRTYKRKTFRLNEHLERFYNSATLLELEIPLSKAELGAVIEEGLGRNPSKELSIRMTLTGGVSEDFMTPGKPSLIVSFYPLHTLAKELYKKGAKAITLSHVRHLPTAKSLNYLTAVLGVKAAKVAGAVEAIYTDSDGQLYEGTGSNLFVVKNGVVITPGKDVLKGITRGVIPELCKKLGLEYRENRVTLNDVNEASEMFITSTSKELLPVVQLDEARIGNGEVGEITKQLLAAFQNLVEAEIA